MHISIFSEVIAGRSPSEVATKIADYGLGSVQFLPAYTHRQFGQTPLEASTAEWADAFAAADVPVTGVAAYLNILHPDPRQRRANLDMFKVYLREAKLLGTRYVATETGTGATSSDWDFDDWNRTAEAWDMLRSVTEELLATARDEDVVLLLEPYSPQVCDSPETVVRLLDEFDSPHLGLVMDPTNWFSLETAKPECVDDVIRSGFDIERGRYFNVHAKDVDPTPDNGKPSLPAPGKGIMNYELYVSLLAADGYDGPIVIEHLDEADIPRARDFIVSQLAAVPVGDAR